MECVAEGWFLFYQPSALIIGLSTLECISNAEGRRPKNQPSAHTTPKVDKTTPKAENTTQKPIRDTAQKILDLLTEDPYLTRQDIAPLLNLTPDGVKYHLTRLQKLGYLLRTDGRKSGRWKVLIKK